MGKKLTLLFTFLLMLGLFAGYLYLTEKTTSGNLKIAAGEKQIKEGESMLANGKAKLSNGQQRLSQAKNSYNSIKTVSYLSAVAIPLAGGFLAITTDQVMGSKISQGSKLIANGQNKIKAGEEQLKAGKESLRLGKLRLKKANQIRIACGFGSIFCAVLLIGFGICWGRKRESEGITE